MNAYCVRGQASFNMFLFILIYTYSMNTANENYQQLMPAMKVTLKNRSTDERR